MRKVTFDASYSKSATSRARGRCKETIELARKIAEDPGREDRLARQHCLACYYFIRIAGAAMTEASCAVCGKTELYGSTATELLCLECARERDLCRQCGGALDVWKGSARPTY